MSVPASVRLAPLAAALALGACWDIPSDVQAITDEARLTSLPIQAGYYCGVDVDFDDAGAIDEIDYDECFKLGLDNGRILLPADTDGLSEFDVAGLSRGAYLMQAPNEDDDGFVLLIAMMREEGVAILLPPLVTPAVKSYADQAGVALDIDAGDDLEADPPDIHVVSGEPGDVLAFFEHVASARFDEGLRDPAVAAELLTEALYYVRVDADPDVTSPDEALVRARIEALGEAIHRAMILE